MSGHRLLLTSAAMAAAACLLRTSTPGVGPTVDALVQPQRTVDTAGADTLLLAAAGAAAWTVWVWGALGLALTLASVAPGVGGAAARGLLQVLLPAGARRAAAVALGLGLAAPVLLAGPGGGPGGVDRPALAAAVTTWDVPDWPRAGQTTVPDWPTEPPATAPSATAPPATAPPATPPPTAPPLDQPLELPDGAHVVAPGDCLWDIAADRLGRAGSEPGAARIAAAVQDWWQVNADVIGPDPDLVLPGQVLHPPPQP